MARFRNIRKNVSKSITYGRRRARGHSPMNGWMVNNRIAKYLFRHNSKQYDEVMKK